MIRVLRDTHKLISMAKVSRLARGISSGCGSRRCDGSAQLGRRVSDCRVRGGDSGNSCLDTRQSCGLLVRLDAIDDERIVVLQVRDLQTTMSRAVDLHLGIGGEDHLVALRVCSCPVHLDCDVCRREENGKVVRLDRYGGRHASVPALEGEDEDVEGESKKRNDCHDPAEDS